MRIITNAEELGQRFGLAAKMIEKANIKTMKGVTYWGEIIAKRLAPEASGDLKRRIKRKPIKRNGKIVSSSLESTVPRHGKYYFPYHFWVNENIRSVRLKPPFGDGRRRTYRSVARTGVPGYFRLTAELLAKKFPAMVQKELIRTLKILEVK